MRSRDSKPALAAIVRRQFVRCNNFMLQCSNQSHSLGFSASAVRSLKFTTSEKASREASRTAWTPGLAGTRMANADSSPSVSLDRTPETSMRGSMSLPPARLARLSWWSFTAARKQQQDMIVAPVGPPWPKSMASLYSCPSSSDRTIRTSASIGFPRETLGGVAVRHCRSLR